MYKKEDIISLINKFEKENKRIPIHPKEFKGGLFTSYQNRNLSSYSNIILFYNSIGINTKKYIQAYLLDTIYDAFYGDNKQDLRYSKINNKNENTNIYRAHLLFLYEFYKQKNNKYPSYKEFKKSYYMPMIVGIDEKENLEYNSFFNEDELFKKYLSKSDFNQLIKMIEKRKEEEIKNRENIKTKDSSLAENIFSILAENYLKKYINNNFSYRNKKENFINSSLILLQTKESKQLFNKNIDIFYSNILNLEKIFKVHLKDKKYINIKWQDQNKIKTNFKGYDYSLILDDFKIFISYKFKKGRAYSNLSLKNIFKKSFLEIIHLKSSAIENIQEKTEKIDKIIYLNYLESVFEDRYTYLESEIKKQKITKNLIEEIPDIVSEILPTIKLNTNQIFSLFKIEKNKIFINNEKDYTEFTKKIFSILEKEFVRNLTTKKITTKDKFLKDKKIFSEIKIPLKKLNILTHTFLYKENDVGLYKNEYKYIIKLIYRNKDIMKFVSNKINLEYNFDKLLFSYLKPVFRSEFVELENKLNSNDMEKKNFLKYVLHLDIIEDENVLNTYLIYEEKILESLNLNPLEKKLKDIKIKFGEINETPNGIEFDMFIKYLDKNLISFKKNQIKSKDGKFIDRYMIDFSSNNIWEKEIIKNLNNEYKLEKQQTNKLDNDKKIEN